MPPSMLEGESLGKKHQHFNKLVHDAIANKQYELSNINSNDSDIENLLKIEIASKTRNVEYIIEVMKSNDMLYASTAIKKSTWLITDNQYANIINPEYLYTQLLPIMNTKAFNKLILHIRLNLKDESRVETFYEYLKKTDEAYKWLENCSIPFVENVIQNERTIPLRLFKRLCKKSKRFLRYFERVDCHIQEFISEKICLLKSNTENISKVLEQYETCYVQFLGKRNTEKLMKACPQRVLDNFEKYVRFIDLSVVAKYLKKEEIKPFLYKQVKNVGQYFCDFNRLSHFIKNMPAGERSEFIKQTFIDRTDLSLFRSEDGMINFDCPKESYQWYEYFPFDVAFTELKKLIRAENSTTERFNMLSVLVTCAKQDPQHTGALLKYFYKKHVNEPFKFKIQFINNLLIQIPTHRYDVKTWNVLDQIFHSMEVVYAESEYSAQKCFMSIILYKVLHDEAVPEIIEKKASFNTFKNIKKQLNQEQNDKLFTYLLNSVLKKIENIKITDVSDFNETTNLLRNALTLLVDWKKDITEYPFVLVKIQELIKIKKDNNWKTNMSGLYNMNKSWRKHLFEESFIMNPSEEVCLNALKHKPQLLTEHDQDIETLRTNDAVSLRRVLAKLRVYWPHSLAQQWTHAYLRNLNKPKGQKAVIKGLFMLLPQNQIIGLAKKHVPEDFKINWGETEASEIYMRKVIAQNLHVARPIVPFEAVLWYAKGDYLQYAVSSLSSILSNLSKVETLENLPKLLKAPVSLQKFGIYVVTAKLNSNELKTIFSNIWNTTKNPTIRSILFKKTYSQMCNVHDPVVEKELWQLLSIFIDSLSADDDKDIYKKMSNIDKIPDSVYSEFYIKSYQYLTSLPERANRKTYVKSLVGYAALKIGLLDEDFVVDVLLSSAGTKFCSNTVEFIDIFANFALCGKTEEEQLRRFKRLVYPAIEQAFQSWDTVNENHYYVRSNFNKFLRTLFYDSKRFVTVNNVSMPTKLFMEIKKIMNEKLPLLNNYVMYTTWKLKTELIKLMAQYCPAGAFESIKSDDIDSKWNDIRMSITPAFGSVIVNCLKEDVEQHFITILFLFGDALENIFFILRDLEFSLKTLEHMLNYDDSVPTYLVVSKVILNHNHLEDKLKIIKAEIRKKIEAHPSEIVRTHYHNDFRKLATEE